MFDLSSPVLMALWLTVPFVGLAFEQAARTCVRLITQKGKIKCPIFRFRSSF